MSSNDRIDGLRAPIEAANGPARGIMRCEPAAALPGADRADLLAAHVDAAIDGGMDDQGMRLAHLLPLRLLWRFRRDC